MTLWRSCYFLVVGLFVCSAAPTPEECPQLVSPVSVGDASMMFGRWEAVAGYSDSDLFINIIKMTDSSWMRITNGSDGAVEFFESNKINGQCFIMLANMHVEGGVPTMSFMNMTTVFHVLPTTDGCLVLDLNSTMGNVDQLLSTIDVSAPGGGREHIRSLYLMGRGSAAPPCDLERFKQQARCLGFSRESDYRHDSEKGFCAEGESARVLGSAPNPAAAASA